MNTYTKHFEFFAFVIGALALCVWALVTIPNVHAITFGNTEAGAISETYSFPNRFQLKQELNTTGLGNATTTLYLSVVVSSSTLEVATSTNWLAVGCAAGEVGIITLAESVTNDGVGPDGYGTKYTVEIGNTFYGTYPTCTIGTWSRLVFLAGTTEQIYGEITTVDNYPGGDAIWQNNFGADQSSDTIISDTYFQITTQQNIFELFGTSTVTIGTASSTVDCSAYDDTAFFSSSTIAAIGCYIKEAAVDTLNFLIVPDAAGGLTFLNNQFSKFQDVFPFSLFFNFNELASFTLESYNYENATLNFSVFGTEFALISSSTLTAFVGQANKDLIFDLQKYLAWFAMIWLAYVIAIKKKN